MEILELNKFYTRKDIHDIFAPDAEFTQGSGRWGSWGILPIPDRNNDFIFFVTYGQSVGKHKFDEGITEDGVLSWQSQEAQGFENKYIQTFISHNELSNNIYLFLRESGGKDVPYEYLGNLKYLSHDSERQNPVYFQWQLLDWNKNDSITEIPTKAKSTGGITLSDKSPNKKKRANTTSEFRARKSPDYAARDLKNKNLGNRGEELVLKYEKKELELIGRKDLAEKVIHIAKVEGDGAGYDIKSYDKNEEIKYIEVKTTEGNINTDFYMSPREIQFSKEHKKNFYLYRIFDLNKSDEGSLHIIRGDITEEYEIIPTGFRLSKN